MELSQLDLIIFGVYIIGVIGFGVWIANRDKNTTASDYFLASRSLPWWAVGGSLIASNISAEQIIGMNGSGFELGLAIATYELMAAITLILVAKFLLPVFLKKGIYTMPQFLEERYDGTVRTIMSVFWIALFVFINIASVLYLGALAIEQLLGVPLAYGIIGLVLYSASFSIFGGLKAVVWTDVLQVIVLMVGGTAAAWGILSFVGDGSVLTGISELMAVVPERFEMLFEPTDVYVDTLSGETKSSFQLLPGFALLFGGMWIVNSYYWGNNQYIIQRALAAKDLPEAQKGVAFAAFMKVFIPFFAVLPGIAAFYLTKKGVDVDVAKADQVFPWVLSNYVGEGLRGITFAALVAAIGSSISSMVNSASTIFTLDIYQKFINPASSERNLVRVGQVASAAALVIGALVAPVILGGEGQVFQYIQEYTGFISPGVFTVFIFGMFWRGSTSKAALVVVLSSIPLSFLFKEILPGLPFLDRMAFIFVLSGLMMIVISKFTAGSDTTPDLTPDTDQTGISTSDQRITNRKLAIGLAIGIVAVGIATAIRLFVQEVPDVPAWFTYAIFLLSVLVIGLLLGNHGVKDNVKAIDLNRGLFKTSMSFNISAVAIILILTAIYSLLA
ncbi:sodium/glucose cotransporter [Lewinellaceae bacterium SD302]|nr:sodium/glucose cotransporter [Lewinellaceae bacterium SD302]